MSTTQTLREPKMKHRHSSSAPQSTVEVEESLTPRGRFRLLGRRIAERRRLAGLPEETDLTMDEIVAICKEARAERYAEEQKQKNSTDS